MSRGSIAALVLAALVAGAAFGFELRSELRSPVARAQDEPTAPVEGTAQEEPTAPVEDAAQAAPSARGPVRISSTATQNEAFCFLFNESTMQLASYTRKHDGTLELNYVRKCEWDFNSRIDELPKTNHRYAPANMKKLATR